jgi:hypothetical protein
MGFFSSKKVDADAGFVDTDNMSVVQTIRSRFVGCFFFLTVQIRHESYRQYGKSKGKEREVISSPVISSPGSPSTQRSGDKLATVKGKSQSATLLKKERSSTGYSASTNGTMSSPNNPPSPSQSTDPMTYGFIFLVDVSDTNLRSSATLAQRLNELAVSNSEGLLK